MGFHLFDLRCLDCLWSLESVVLEQALLNSAIWELHPPNAVLDASLPLAFVARAIFPVHFSIAMPLVVLVAPLVVVSTFPSELTHAVLFVILVLPFIHVAILSIESLAPLASTVLQSVLEFSNIYTSIFPLVLALALRLAVAIGAREDVPVCENV